MSRLCFACLLLPATGAVMIFGSFFGRVHRYTARVSPAIRAGKGWRGRRELAPRCSATQLGAFRNEPGQTRRCLQLSVPPTSPTPTTPYTTNTTNNANNANNANNTTPTLPTTAKNASNTSNTSNTNNTNKNKEQDRLGNNAADEAADFGRRRVDHSVIDARRCLSGVCGRGTLSSWCCTGSFLPFLGLWSIMMGILVRLSIPWSGSAGALSKRRRLVACDWGPCHVAWTSSYQGCWVDQYSGFCSWCCGCCSLALFCWCLG